ncbi:hypothetical protein G6F35_017634 [Rhizopus arrhizus]|nr:hypothetical protein G6F35_017634 [Rhizopus arrhizus]
MQQEFGQGHGDDGRVRQHQRKLRGPQAPARPPERGDAQYEIQRCGQVQRRPRSSAVQADGFQQREAARYGVEKRAAHGRPQPDQRQRTAQQAGAPGSQRLVAQWQRVGGVDKGLDAGGRTSQRPGRRRGIGPGSATSERKSGV